MTDLEQLANGLTEAQRRALLACPVGSMVNFVLFCDGRGQVPALREYGLVDGFADMTGLTSRGLRVRDILRAKQGNENAE